MADNSVGIDIGKKNVKYVQLTKKGQSYTLAGYGVFDRKSTEKIVQAFSQAGFKGASLRVNIDDPSLKMRRVMIPNVPEDELDEVVRWSCNDFLGKDIEHYIIRHQRLPVESQRKEATEYPYLIYAITKEAVKKYVESLASLSIKSPEIVEPSMSALTVMANHNYALTEKERIILIDIGFSTALFGVIGKEGLLFSRPLKALAGEALTKQISRSIGQPDAKSEQLKISLLKGQDVPADIASRVKNSLSLSLSRASVEIKRSIDAFKTQYPDDKVSRILFSGGGSFMEDLPSHISKVLDIEAKVADPFLKIDLGLLSTPDVFATQKNYFALACGLALE